ncbi:hypothetical protein C7S18_17270 [Ahniella affigens]|uniref:Uncharacterized protein n=1 Tax=Ahniella affigens TaxID=2021234 RepID=A0A2P1PVE5_9GAMM|nr:hypothetical protein [Ahniella affigens]AVP98823.1 hypothetical protein C7S18_17270 [Ahniella affigens]
MQIKTLTLALGLALTFNVLAEDTSTEQYASEQATQESSTGSRIRRLAPLTVNPTAVSHHEADAKPSQPLKQENQDAFLDGVAR